MANEKRLIDANIMPHGQFWEGLTDKEKAKVLAYLVMSPTVDAVEVVRCEKCKHWGELPSGCICMRFGYCSECSMHTASDHFCSFGEG